MATLSFLEINMQAALICIIGWSSCSFLAYIIWRSILRHMFGIYTIGDKCISIVISLGLGPIALCMSILQWLMMVLPDIYKDYISIDFSDEAKW